MKDPLLNRLHRYGATFEDHLASIPVPGPTGHERNHSPRGRRLTLVGVMVVVLAATTGIVALAHRTDPSVGVSTTETDTTSPSTSSIGPTSTTAPPPRNPAEISIRQSALPVGIHLLDELPRNEGEILTVVARYALDGAAWSGQGPYLRVVLHRNPKIGSDFISTTLGRVATTTDIHAHPVLESTDDATDPSSADLPPEVTDRVGTAWVTLAFAYGPDQLVLVQGKGLSKGRLRSIAAHVQIGGCTVLVPVGKERPGCAEPTVDNPSTSVPATTASSSTTSTPVPTTATGARQPNFFTGPLSGDLIDPTLAKLLEVTNGYGIIIGDYYFSVLVGSAADDAMDGEALISRTRADGSGTPSFQTAHAPGSGALIATGQDGATIVLTGANGTTHHLSPVSATID